MKWRAYPEYKPSGCEWLGEIPEHWDIEKLKHISSVQFSNVDKKAVEGEDPVRLCNYVDVYYNEFITTTLELMEATATQLEIRKFQLHEGDVLITKDSEAWDDIAVPACVTENHDRILCGYHLAQIRPNPERIDGKYLFRSFCSRGINDQFRVAATGITRYGLGKYWIDNGLFPVPPIDEQRAIAAFLDRETARIDALIEKKQQQIELLQEKRAVLISHAVTKGLPAAAAAQAGLNPNVKMKPSGIEWLGEIPEHWEVLPIKRITSIPVTDGPHETPELLDDGIPFISAEAIKNDKIDFSKKRGFISAEEHARFSRKYKPQKGDIYMVKSGATTGNVAYVDTDKEFNIWSPLAVIRPNKKAATTPYVFFFMKSRDFFQSIELGWSYGTQQNIGMNVIENLPIVLPPLSEQKSISAFLDRETARIDALTKKVQESLVKLSEYRTALISAAVTGKIDVRKEVKESRSKSIDEEQ